MGDITACLNAEDELKELREENERLKESIHWVTSGIARKELLKVDSIRSALRESEERCQDKWGLMNKTLKDALREALEALTDVHDIFNEDGRFLRVTPLIFKKLTKLKAMVT